MRYSQPGIDRRQFHAIAAAAVTGLNLAQDTDSPGEQPAWEPRYLLGSSMYGRLNLGEILPEVRKTGATAIDIWPAVHGNQREQLDDLGEEEFSGLLDRHEVSLGCITRFDLGPFGLQDEMRLARRLGCQTIVTGGAGPVNLKSSELKSAVAAFAKKMEPHLTVAEETGVTVAIENHADNLIDSPDSMKWLAEMARGRNLGLALAPFHLPQDEALIASLISELGDSIRVFYAWQYGNGCREKMPKEQELLQLPGRGKLDFAPLVDALAKIRFQGWTEIFMHPVPRGIPIMDTAAEVTAEINRSRTYLADLIPQESQMP